ncbi:hypothetical protein DFH08DRAFT_842942 [Mycena albidolilacea]|uniref:Uncharacterized protein n=1 Tax=Mycena albidolilacea TaxID=1033008 RepID=A0AAD7AL37_9AGAR|nr:hypothetical protein DFH08DRAFT_842942 [Mycena albidolilacea]
MVPQMTETRHHTSSSVARVPLPKRRRRRLLSVRRAMLNHPYAPIPHTRTINPHPAVSSVPCAPSVATPRRTSASSEIWAESARTSPVTPACTPTRYAGATYTGPSIATRPVSATFSWAHFYHPTLIYRDLRPFVVPHVAVPLSTHLRDPSMGWFRSGFRVLRFPAAQPLRCKAYRPDGRSPAHPHNT